MTGKEVLQLVTQAGARLVCAGEQLTVKAPQPLSGALVTLIRRHKPDLLALLRSEQHEVFEERSAIMQYDGGLSRVAAEALAQHGAVIDILPCPACNGMSYKYADGHVRCTTPWCTFRTERAG
jgi:hypothetical protein